jgi:hypothetical protein
MKALETRNEAIKLNKKTYHGSKCKNCQNTIRYVNGHNCVYCMAKKSKSDIKKKYDAEYHKKNAEKKKEIAKKWIKNNKEKRKFIIFTYDSKRRAIKKIGDSFSAVKKWAENQKKICYWCNINCEKKYHIDHYFPLAKGGSHTIDNLVIACPSCNMKKNAKDPFCFANEKGRLF